MYSRRVRINQNKTNLQEKTLRDQRQKTGLHHQPSTTKKKFSQQKSLHYFNPQTKRLSDRPFHNTCTHARWL